MASTPDIAERYFAALAAHDLDGATACWKPGAIDRLVGAQDLVAPDGIRAYPGDPVTGDVRRALEQAAEAP